ncbi:MAG: DegT/DnrJ/EryC1/StrS family aminotransferase [Alphaproteobacteria bacterium]
MIPIFEPFFYGREREYLRECIDTGWISSQGRFIPAFEGAFAGRHDMAFGVATSNCTTALHLSLAVLGIGPGDEVLCPDLTFIAPANMIRLTGATAVLVDVDPVSWGIDPARIAEKITPRTRAVIVVHAFGHAADMEPIMALAKAHGLRVIEDVAEAPGATCRSADGVERVVGTIGDLSCYSFFANKIMTTGEGGMILTNDATFDGQLRILRDHGMSQERRYVHEVVGFNYRMTNMQAGVGLAQLDHLDIIQTRRDAQAEHYARRFAAAPRVTWRPTAPWCRPVHWLATISLPHRDLRDPLLAHLKDRGIDARQMVYPVHMARPYRGLHDDEDFPVSLDVSLRSLHLPSSTGLLADQVDLVCDTVLAWLDVNDG